MIRDLPNDDLPVDGQPAGDTPAEGPPPADDADDAPEDGLLERLKAWFREDREHRGAWIKEAKEAFAIVAGDQWSDEDRRALADQRRPALTFNRAAPVIDAMSGAEISNRQEIRYIPRTLGDEQVNEVLTEAARYFRDECDAEHEESNAFRDAAISGEGWTETRLDYENNPDGDIVVEQIDPLEIYPDCAARKANYADARRLWRVQAKVPIERARALFPDFSDSELDAAWSKADAAEDDDEAVDATPPRYVRRGGDTTERIDGRARKTVTLVQVQWFEREAYFRGVLSDPLTGNEEALELTPAEHAVMRKRAPEAGKVYRAVEQRRRVFRQAWIGSVILESGDAPCPGHFSFNCVTGKLDRNKGVFYGMTRAMKDPQQWANKWLSQALHILNAQAKGGIVAEEGIASDETAFEDSWANADAITYVRKGTLTAGVPAFQPKPQASFPPQLTQLMEMAIASIRDVTGVNAELLGSRNADQPASLEYQRRQAGTTILAAFFDSLRRYRKRQGRVLMRLITDYVSDGRLIRIMGEDGARYVPLLRQDGATRYDVIVDEAPSSPNQKELTWAILQPVLPIVLKLGVPQEVILALLEMTPLPASAVDKLRKALTAGADAPKSEQEQQLQAMMAEIERLKQQAAVRKTEADAAKAEAEASKAEAEAARATIETRQMLAGAGGQMPLGAGGFAPGAA